jgi:hypothetical protein
MMILIMDRSWSGSFVCGLKLDGELRVFDDFSNTN